jgi:hypothetical protein
LTGSGGKTPRLFCKTPRSIGKLPEQLDKLPDRLEKHPDDPQVVPNHSAKHLNEWRKLPAHRGKHPRRLKKHPDDRYIYRIIRENFRAIGKNSPIARNICRSIRSIHFLNYFKNTTV